MAASAPASEGSIYFVGTATTIIRFGGLTLLTDPNFLHKGQRAYLGRGLSSRRRTQPALSVEELPKLDAVVLSHLHGDHFDRVARRGLDKSLPVLTTRHAARHLRLQGFGQAVPMKTWQAETLTRGSTSVRVTSLPGRHTNGPLRQVLPPVMGSLLEFETRPGEVAFRLYITGDTLVYPDLAEIRSRHPEIDLALLHLGGTRILGKLVTMDAAQGIELLELIRPRAAVPIHYDDYPVFKSPLADFQALAARGALPTSLSYLSHGESLPIRAG
ncbi:MAG: MBL fold metallo-hydrolase [Mycobacteriales bacterium]